MYVKYTITLRKDNIIHFVNKNKKPLDSKINEIIRLNKFSIDDQLQPSEIEMLRIKNRKLFTMS